MWLWGLAGLRFLERRCDVASVITNEEDMKRFRRDVMIENANTLPENCRYCRKKKD